MKWLIILPMLLLFFVKSNAQNGRWMYLFKNKGVTLMIDTLTNDIKQFDDYNGHEKVVLIWVKAVQTKSSKKGSFIESDLIRYAIDTSTNQMEVVSASIYHNNNQIHSKSFTYLAWQDVIPESGGDLLISFCRALHDQNLMQKIISNASLYDHKTSSTKK